MAASTSSGADASDHRQLFMSETPLDTHIDVQLTDYAHYVSTLTLLLRHGIEVSRANRVYALVAALARRDFELGHFLLSRPEHYTVVEVLKAAQILDNKRRLAQCERKARGRADQNLRRDGNLAARINELRAESVPVRDDVKLTLANSVVKRLKAWVGTIPVDDLVFYAMAMPRQPWCELADLLHLRPDHFAVDWFLPVCFGGTPPPGTPLANLEGGIASNTVDYLLEWRPAYSVVRRMIDPADLDDDAKGAICGYASLKDVLWYYEELACPSADEAIGARLEAGEEVDMAYGKLVERLLMLQDRESPLCELLIPVAERAMSEIHLPMDPPVVVIGDASASMDVAIRTATIIASVICYIASADLVFFNNKHFVPELVPRSITDVLHIANTIKASRATRPSATMMEYYNNREVVNVFVMVTDEVENRETLLKKKGYRFADVYKMYCEEVHPAKLVMVSFLDRGVMEGQMVREMRVKGCPPPLQFRLDAKRPDLNKLTQILGMLASQTEDFAAQANALADDIVAQGKLAAAVPSPNPNPSPFPDPSPP